MIYNQVMIYLLWEKAPIFLHSVPFFNHLNNNNHNIENNNGCFFSLFLLIKLFTEETTNLKFILVLLSFTDWIAII